MKFVWAAASGGCAAKIPKTTSSATSATAPRVRFLRSMALASEASRGCCATILVAADADRGIVPRRLRVGSRKAAHSTGPSFGMRYVQPVARAAKIDGATLVAHVAVIGSLLCHQLAVSFLVEGGVMRGRLQAEVGRMAEIAGAGGAGGRGGAVTREALRHGGPARSRLGVDGLDVTGLARGAAREVRLVAECVGQSGTGYRGRIEERMTVRAGGKSARGGSEPPRLGRRSYGGAGDAAGCRRAAGRDCRASGCRGARAASLLGCAPCENDKKGHEKGEEEEGSGRPAESEACPVVCLQPSRPSACRDAYSNPSRIRASYADGPTKDVGASGRNAK